MIDYLGKEEATDESVMEEIASTIYDNSLPLFRRMIEVGKVRVTFIDHNKVSIVPIHDLFKALFRSSRPSQIFPYNSTT